MSSFLDLTSENFIPDEIIPFHAGGFDATSTE
jgi:hypothetical protein